MSDWCECGKAVKLMMRGGSAVMVMCQWKQVLWDRTHFMAGEDVSDWRPCGIAVKLMMQGGSAGR